MSAIYHICPSGLNFQFGGWDSFLMTCYKDAHLLLHADTAFMFIIGGLLTVKVLQSRHPDINAYAYIAFFCFAIVIFLTMIGIVSGTCRVANKIFAPPLFPSISHD